MPSDSGNESSSLKARLKAKLKEAGVGNSDSSDDEDKSKKNKSGLKSSTSAIPGTLSLNDQGGSRMKKNNKKNLNGIDKFVLSSDDEEDVITSKCRKPKPLESDESDSDESTVSRPRASSKKRSNVLSSSEDDGPGDAASSGSDASDDESDGDDANSDESEDDDSEACSMIDNEAEEGEESDVSEEEEPLGETLGSESSEYSGSDDGSDWISDADEPCQTNTKSSGRHVATSNSAAATCGFASDSSDGTSEKCPICLLRFSNQEVGTPESCDHIFCAECLEQWSKNVNTCPVDRQEFTLILVRRRVGGKVVRQIAVERSEAKDPDEVEDPTYCEVCGNCDREDRMLLCDGCDLGYHMECLDPPLNHVPVDNWYCSECDHNTSTNSNGAIAEAVDVGIDEVRELLDDAQNLVGAAPLTRRAQRMLPRTQQMERVLRRIRSTFLQRQEALLSQPSTSSGIESQNGEPKRKKRRVVKRKSTTKKKTKSTTKRKTKLASKKKSAAKKRVSKKKATKKKTTGKKRKARKAVGSKSKRMKVCSES